MLKFNDLIFIKHDNFDNAKQCRIMFKNKQYISIIGAIDKNKQSHVYGDGEETFELWTSELQKTNQDVEAHIHSERINEVLKEFHMKFGKPTHMNDMQFQDLSGINFN